MACKYDYRCADCGTFELTHTFAEVKGSHACPHCGGPAVQDYAAKLNTLRYRIPPGFSRYTARDFLPPEVVGAGPFSQERKDFRDKTFATREI